MIQLVTWARVFVSHTGDGSIDKSRRERSLRGPRKKVNDLGICWSWFVAELVCYLKSSSLNRAEQSRDWNVLLSQRWGEVKVARDVYVQERGLWSTVEKRASRIIIIRVYREYSFESVLVCLYILNSPFLSLVFTARRWFRRLISTVDR